MKIAVMQPYLFPYVGYFQLIHSVDKFVILDDVNFINRGWINRNRILVNNADNIFTIPLKDASQNKKICDTFISEDLKWQEKLLKTIEMAYKKAPFFKEAFRVLQEIIQINEKNLSAYIFNSLTSINNYLEIPTTMVPSSGIYQNGHLKAQDKILDICMQEKANHYINPIGGLELYSQAEFAVRDIKLNFIKSEAIEYKQFTYEFIPWLSIIDLMMFNSKDQLVNFIEQYSLI